MDSCYGAIDALREKMAKNVAICTPAYRDWEERVREKLKTATFRCDFWGVDRTPCDVPGLWAWQPEVEVGRG